MRITSYRHSCENRNPFIFNEIPNPVGNDVKKKMKKLLTILTLLFCLTSLAQKSDSLVTVKGVVIDSIYGEPAPFIRLCVKDMDDKIFKTHLLDSSGRFNFGFNKYKVKDYLYFNYLGESFTIKIRDIIDTILVKGSSESYDQGKNVEGYVYEKNKGPISNAEINIDGFKYCHLNRYVTKTDSNGYFKTNEVYGGFENLFVISRWNGKKRIEYLNSSNYKNIIIYFDEKIENPAIDPHQMSTGTIYRDGTFESIK